MILMFTLSVDNPTNVIKNDGMPQIWDHFQLENVSFHLLPFTSSLFHICRI